MENLGDVATRVVMLTTQGLLETSMIILMILLCDWRIALVSLAGVAIFLVINTVMQNAGKQTKRLNAANEACVRANVVLGLDTMDIDGKELNPENHDIEVKNIEFSYDKRKIIDGISLTIPGKTTTAIVGPSGGGKTTLCNLIARFWDVDLGEITHEEVVEAANVDPENEKELTLAVDAPDKGEDDHHDRPQTQDHKTCGSDSSGGSGKNSPEGNPRRTHEAGRNLQEICGFERTGS